MKNAVAPPDLSRSFGSRRTLISSSLSALTILAVAFALIPLASVLWTVIARGGAGLTWESVTSLPPTSPDGGGGFGNALAGTAIIVAIAGAFSIPMGVMAALHLSEFAGPGRFADSVRFSAKILTGMPSILAGVFAYVLLVEPRGLDGFSAWAGGLGIGVLMLPTVMLTAEESLRRVPMKMREAAFGLGATRTQVALKVVLPAAFPGLSTGVLLSVARGAGETAPLLFTALSSQYWPEWPYDESTASMATFIHRYANVPFPEQVRLAWTASLVLILAVLALNLAGRFVASRSSS